MKLMFKASNNESKYKALILGIKLCYTARANSIKAYSGSQLVVSQLNGEHEVKDNTMAAYCMIILAVNIYAASIQLSL